jgi:hypothetical protein
MTVSVKTYSWGTLRIISRGISYSCIIHPEHWAVIESAPDGAPVSFTDETGRRWRGTKQDGNLQLRSKSYWLSVPLSRLAA